MSVLEPSAFNGKYEVYHWRSVIGFSFQMVCWAANSQGELFGEDRLLRVFCANRQHQRCLVRFSRLWSAFPVVSSRMMCLLESNISTARADPAAIALLTNGGATRWTGPASFEFSWWGPCAILIRCHSYLPVAGGDYGLAAPGRRIVRSLAELYSNALDTAYSAWTRRSKLVLRGL
jgi:hypothetical protein